MITLRKQLSEHFTRRYRFIDSLKKDDFVKTWVCPKHKVMVALDSKCPECEEEKRIAKLNKEIMQNNLFGKMNKDLEEQKQNAHQIKSILKENNDKNKALNIKLKSKKYKEDEEFRKYLNKASEKSRRKSQLRKKEHSI